MIPVVLKNVFKYLREVELHLNPDAYDESAWFAKTNYEIGEKLDSSHPIFQDS